MRAVCVCMHKFSGKGNACPICTQMSELLTALHHSYKEFAPPVPLADLSHFFNSVTCADATIPELKLSGSTGEDDSKTARLACCTAPWLTGFLQCPDCGFRNMLTTINLPDGFNDTEVRWRELGDLDGKHGRRKAFRTVAGTGEDIIACI